MLRGCEICTFTALCFNFGIPTHSQFCFCNSHWATCWALPPPRFSWQRFRYPASSLPLKRDLSRLWISPETCKTDPVPGWGCEWEWNSGRGRPQLHGQGRETTYQSGIGDVTLLHKTVACNTWQYRWQYNTRWQSLKSFCQVVHYTGREYPGTTQLAAARVLTSLYRLGGAREVEGVVTFRVLPCLVRYVEAWSNIQQYSLGRSCKKEETAEMRVLAADTLAYLIEVDMASHITSILCRQVWVNALNITIGVYEVLSTFQWSWTKAGYYLFVQVSADLQRVAAISNHLISTMASFLRWEPEPQVMKVCSSIWWSNVNRFDAPASAQMYVVN